MKCALAMVYKHLWTFPWQHSFHPVQKHVKGIAGTLRKNHYLVRTSEEGRTLPYIKIPAQAVPF